MLEQPRNSLETLRICGIDGCLNGWVVASSTSVDVIRTFDEIVDNFDVIGIDMPIGLPRSPARRADAQARAFLRTRSSTIFPTPPRDIVETCFDYTTANAQHRARHGKGLTRQSFNLFPKIREVDRAARAIRHGPPTLVEIHPDCAFARMAGRPLPAKRSARGRDDRVRLVEQCFGAVPIAARGAQEHDVLDAWAVLWSARRYAAGTHVTFGDGETDDAGLPMRIVS
jgi:predicted RNase H-like nuclease